MTTQTDRNKYLKGYSFWNANAFWRDPKRKFSARVILYYETWLTGLRMKEKTLTKLQ